MAAERNTKQQIQAYRFGVRRVQHALETGVSYRRNLHGPRFGLSMIIGLVIGSLILAGFAIYGLVRPAPDVGDASVLIDTDAGGAYVVRDGVAHPATNIASAMLAAVTATEGESGGGGVTPVVARVNSETLGDLPRGPMLGIIGAPAQLPTEEDLTRDVWQVCDVLDSAEGAAPGTVADLSTTVIIGSSGPPPVTEGEAALVATSDGRTELIVEGRRTRVDSADPAVSQALGITGGTARPISVGLLNAIPEGPPIERPEIDGVGSPVDLGPRSYVVGAVFAVQRAAGGEGTTWCCPTGSRVSVRSPRT